MTVTPIAGLCLGLEYLTNNDPADDRWEWAYVFSLLIVRIAVIKYT
jgi:hypothetical protein